MLLLSIGQINLHHRCQFTAPKFRHQSTLLTICFRFLILNISNKKTAQQKVK